MNDKTDTADELEAMLNSELEGAVLIGDEGDRKNYYPAIVGIDWINGRVVYDRDKLVQCFVKSSEMSYEDADEWVSYNVERSIPYWGPKAPIIMQPVEDSI